MKTMKDHKVAERLIEHFGTAANAARALSPYSPKISRQLISIWDRQGFIPPRWAENIETVTGGKIKALEVMETAIFYTSSK